MANFLSRKTSGVQVQPLAVLIYGGEKAGKTTLIDSVDGLILQILEDGRGLLKTEALPQPADYDEALAQIVELATEDHSYTSVGVDSISVLEELARRKVASDHGKESIGQINRGQGYVITESLIGNYIEALQACRRKGMSIFAIAHAKVEHYEDPILGDYTRLEPSVHKRIKDAWCRWADIIGYLEIEKMAIDRGEDGRQVRTSMVTGSRYLRLQESGSFIAGNRFGLPSEIEIPAENGWAQVRNRIVANLEAAKGTTKTTNEEAA